MEQEITKQDVKVVEKKSRKKQDKQPSMKQASAIVEGVRSPQQSISIQEVSEDSKKALGIIKKKICKSPLAKQVVKVLSVSEVKNNDLNDSRSNKKYYVLLKYWGGDKNVHQKTVKFGAKPKETDKRPVDFIDHQDEKLRLTTLLKFRKNPEHTPLEQQFWRKTILNNLPTIEESYKDTLDTLKKGWGYEYN